MFIDSHAHLTYDPVYENIEELLQRAHVHSVNTIINVCTDQVTLERGLQLKKTHPEIFNIGCTTPHDVEAEGEQMFPIFQQAALEKQLVAIGETGLDYYYEHSNKKEQQKFFIAYLELALACKLPVVIHCRDAFTDLFSILDRHFKQPNVLLHCFTGSEEEAKQALDRGYYLSMSGIATFKRSQALRDTFQNVPLSSLVIETDTPYLAPQSKRGKQNEPAFLIETATVLAELHQCSLEEVAKATTENTKKFFGL